MADVVVADRPGFKQRTLARLCENLPKTAGAIVLQNIGDAAIIIQIPEPASALSLAGVLGFAALRLRR